MRQKILTLLTGAVLGMALVSGGYAAANTVLAASPSTQTFYLNGLSAPVRFCSFSPNR